MVAGNRRLLTMLTPVLTVIPYTTNAAENIAYTGMEKTVVAFLQPVIELFSGNAWLQGIAAIIVTFSAASVFSWVLFKALRRIANKTSAELDDKLVMLLKPPVYYSLLVGGFSYGFALMPLSESVQQTATRSIQSIGVFVWILFLTRFAHLLLTRLAALTDRFSFIQRRTLTLFDNGAKVVIFSLGIYAIFVIWKIDMTAWLASAGIAGIAIGFAAKDTLSNLFSGVFILADAPYKVGDYILLDKGDRGKVIHIGLRSTRILTRDDVEITIPNSIIGNSTIFNQSGGPSEKLRIRIAIGVGYNSDIDKVRDILLTTARNEQLICSSPNPSVRFRVFGASSLDFELRCWVPNPELRGRATDALNTALHKAFTAEGIEIPYAKQDLYIKGLPESLSSIVNTDSKESQKTA